MIQGLIFDKDGTLFDFQSSWGGWFAHLLANMAGANAPLYAELARRMDFDIATERFNPGSIFIAGTSEDMVAAIIDLMPSHTPQTLRQHMRAIAGEPAQVPAIPLAPYLEALRANGLRLGVATNDGESSARAQLQTAGVLDHFHAVAGYDSGFGAKPAPGMLFGVASALGLPASALAMVGDSAHDMHSGKAAGMHRIAVLTGTASYDDLAPHADIVLNHIGEIPDYLAKAT